MKSDSLKIIIITAVSVLCIFQLTSGQSKTDTENEATTEILTYTVRDYEGKVAVFTNNDTTPTVVYDTYTSILPETDRERLEKGITVSSRSDLQKIIEDYTS